MTDRTKFEQMLEYLINEVHINPNLKLLCVGNHIVCLRFYFKQLHRFY